MKIDIRVIFGLFVFYSLGCAEVVHPGSGIIAHVADGGGIQTEITLTNLDDTDQCYALAFANDIPGYFSLVPTPAPSANYYSGVIAAHARLSVRTAGTGSTVTQGWAALSVSGNVGASATFRVSTGPWSGSEATVPVDTWRNNHFSLSFDHTESAIVGLAMVNPLVDPIAVTLTLRSEEGGVLVSDTFTMAPHPHKSIATSSSYPAAAGRRGTIEVSTTGQYMSVVALRFGRSTVNAIVPLVSNKWAAFDNTGWGCWDY